MKYGHRATAQCYLGHEILVLIIAYSTGSIYTAFSEYSRPNVRACAAHRHITYPKTTQIQVCVFVFKSVYVRAEAARRAMIIFYPNLLHAHHFLVLLDFFAGAFSSSSSTGADRFWLTRVLFRVPSVGVFFCFFGALGFDSFLSAAFFAVLALGFSADLSSFLSAFFASESFFSSDLALGVPFVGSFLEPGSFS